MNTSDTTRLLALLDCDRLLSDEETALQNLLDERDQLRAQVAALKVALREDVDLVATACSDFGNDEGPRSIRQLYAQFETRIEAGTSGTDTTEGA